MSLNSLKFTFVCRRSMSCHSSSIYNTLNTITKIPIYSHLHFKLTNRSIPLDKYGLDIKEKNHDDIKLFCEHSAKNTIWTKEDIENRMNNMYHYQPQTITDYSMKYFVSSLYHLFNLISGYHHKNPSLQSMQWRLIVLESFAGVPGFVAAFFKHFRSLRTLESDHGWISTLLEEAENERMHLFISLEMFQATTLTRYLVIGTQYLMTPILMIMYLINPKSLHRFVGYLEETGK